jgi:hypothetical protein
MSTEPETSAPKTNKGGRPKGFSHKQETPGQPKQELLQDDGEYVVIRVKKRELAKLLLRDLI